MVSGYDFPLNQSNDLGTGLFFMVSGWKMLEVTPLENGTTSIQTTFFHTNQEVQHVCISKISTTNICWGMLGIIWINVQSLDTHLSHVQKMKCHRMLLHSTGWSRIAFLAWIVIIPDIIRQYTPPKKHRARGVLNTAQPSAADHQTSLISILLISHYSLLYPILPSIYWLLYRGGKDIYGFHSNFVCWNLHFCRLNPHFGWLNILNAHLEIQPWSIFDSPQKLIFCWLYMVIILVMFHIYSKKTKGSNMIKPTIQPVGM